ncbi:hypothetical protein H4R33_001136 [Dimargaris cristalligena]|nr:hypothetical protein H4R33_001136 [Dimargaris cristalligena]
MKPAFSGVVWAAALLGIVAVPVNATYSTVKPFRRILDGTVVPLPLPFMAFVGNKDSGINAESYCGGTLLPTLKHVVTAAQCLLNRGETQPIALSSLSIGLGSTTLEGMQWFSTANVTIHPEYNYTTLTHDLALIELNETVTVSPEIQPAYIETTMLVEYDTFNTTGWGWTTNDNAQSAAATLQQISVKVSNDREKCQFIDSGFTSSNNHLVCGTFKQNQDTCRGDAGGPLFGRRDDRWSIVGVTSHGGSLIEKYVACGGADPLGFFTHVAYYLPFITETLGVDEELLSVGDWSTNVCEDPDDFPLDTTTTAMNSTRPTLFGNYTATSNVPKESHTPLVATASAGQSYGSMGGWLQLTFLLGNAALLYAIQL